MDAVYSAFKKYVDVEPDHQRPSIAYFSMEYGLDEVLKIYSGGLGMLAGDYLKEASDSNVDLCAIGLLYSPSVWRRLGESAKTGNTAWHRRDDNAESFRYNERCISL